MKRNTLVDRLDDMLETEAFADIDGSPNGLQVGATTGEVETVAFAVDAAQATIDRAAERGADMLVCHHGLWWKGTERLTDRTYDRVAKLVEADMGLYVSHLPLDGHQTYGNAAGVADILDLEERMPFGSLGGHMIGQRGSLETTMPLPNVVEALEAGLEGSVEPIRALAFGPTEIDEVAIVTGSGSDYVDEAVSAGADVLITGEGKHGAYHDARDTGLNVILAGHYATETTGVRSLESLAAEWGLDTVFIDHPTGL